MRKIITVFPIILLFLFLIGMPSFVLAEEPDLQQWFNQNSYVIDVATNKTGMGTFPAGEYRATIRAEFALYAPNNTFGWYSATTGTLHQIFAGEDTVGNTSDFSPTETFGVYIESPDGTFYSEKSRNSDQSDHAWVFLNPKAEGGYVVAWEDMLSGGDKDFQDMTIVMQAFRPPHAAFSWSPPNPQVNETITFNASASTPDGGVIVSYEWDFGDGNTTVMSNPVVTHVYSSFGNYNVTLNVTDSEERSASISHMVTVVAAPHAAFVYSPASPKVNETVTFNASASTPDGGTIVSYEWNFGDGSPTKSAIISTHSYVASGEYIVTLNVTDSEGRWDTESKILQVLKPAEFAVTIEDQWTTAEDRYEFTAPAYCKTFKAEVRIVDSVDLFGYEFWLEFDPTLIQLTNHEVKHIHTEDLVTLEEVGNETGIYKQAVTAKTQAHPYNGSAVVANLWFHIIRDPCYPYNITSRFRLNNTKMTDPNGTAIANLQRHGYFSILSVQAEIGIESEGKTSMVNWVANNTFTVDVNLTDIIRMKGFYIELEWCDCLETDMQNMEVTNLLPPPYELYVVNMSGSKLTVQVKIATENMAINGTGSLLRITFKAKNPWEGIPPYSLVGSEYLPENCTCNISFIQGWIDVYCPEHRRMEFYNLTHGVSVKNHFSYAFMPIPGDLDLDGAVDAVDLSAISSYLGCKSGDPEWAECYRFDLTNDGSIDIFDIVIVSTNMGRIHP